MKSQPLFFWFRGLNAALSVADCTHVWPFARLGAAKPIRKLWAELPSSTATPLTFTVREFASMGSMHRNPLSCVEALRARTIDVERLLLAFSRSSLLPRVRQNANLWSGIDMAALWAIVTVLMAQVLPSYWC